MANRRGLFLGLTTLDIIYRVRALPRIDEKIVAQDQLVAAGGPATNAAVTFAFLGGESTLVSAVGLHALSGLIRDDLGQHRVRLMDLAPGYTGTPAFSSVMVLESTGERSVVSVNARGTQARGDAAAPFARETDILMVDGHQMEASQAACTEARRHGIPCVLDGGSWKEGMQELLPLIDYAILSGRFQPPGCGTEDDVLAHLTRAGTRFVAISRGARPILVSENGVRGEIPVAPTPGVVDTVGAGDVLHGAFCYFLPASGGDFRGSLRRASVVASLSCRYFGTRQWMSAPEAARR